jgi:hypothetical protein
MKLGLHEIPATIVLRFRVQHNREKIEQRLRRFPDKGAYIVTSPTLPFIECEKMHVTLPGSDLAAAIDFYVTKLGWAVDGLGCA